MKDYFSTEIRVFNFHKNPVNNSIFHLQSYLEIEGKPYYQNMDNPKRKEFHYFMGNSVVRISEFSDKANIRIYSGNEDLLSEMKKNIEKIINGEKLV